MFVIANNCGGADYYNLHNTEFNNPFMWSCCFAADILRIIQQFYHINWSNITPTFMTESTAISNNYIEFQQFIPGFIIDGLAEIYYTHYLYDAYCEQPTIRGSNTYHRQNYKYAFQKYISRTAKMCKLTEPPCFLIITYKRHGWNDDTFKQLSTLNTDLKMCIISSKSINGLTPNIKLFYEPDLDSPATYLPITMVKKYNLDITKHFMG
jgi:hypothetical protein